MPDPVSSITYGTVIIGSSPAMLLEAILQAEVGNGPTVIIEANDRIGGSWTPQIRFGHRIDNGPHLLYNFNMDMSEFFAALTRVTGCAFEEIKPAPLSDSRLNKALLEFSFGMRGSLTRKYLRAARGVLARHWMPGLKPFKYWRPEGGLSAVVMHFETELVRRGVEIRISSIVRDLQELPNGAVRVTLDNGETLFAKNVKASAASLPTLAGVASRHSLPNFARRRYAQAYIYLHSARQNVFSFFRFFHDSKIFLAAELSNSAHPRLPEDHTVLSINLVSGMLASDITETEIYYFLQRNRLIEGKGGEPAVANIEWETIEIPVVTEEVTKRINAELKSIEFIHCHNLVRTLYARLEAHKIIG